MIKFFFSISLNFFAFENYGQSHFAQTCDTIHFRNYAAKDADTSQIVVTDYGLADTTATILFGQVVDQKDFTPVINAEISLRYEADIYKTVTDEYGKFRLHCFLGDVGKNYVLHISYANYRCFKIFDATKANYIGLRVKLKRLHAKTNDHSRQTFTEH